jgi:hypothetical protein
MTSGEAEQRAAEHRDHDWTGSYHSANPDDREYACPSRRGRQHLRFSRLHSHAVPGVSWASLGRLLGVSWASLGRLLALAYKQPWPSPFPLIH